MFDRTSGWETSVMVTFGLVLVRGLSAVSLVPRGLLSSFNFQGDLIEVIRYVILLLDSEISQRCGSDD